MSQNNLIKKGLILGIIFLFVGASVVSGMRGNSNRLNSIEEMKDTVSPPLPRWREGGTPYDPDQSLHPYLIHSSKLRDEPTSGLIAAPPEYEPVRGVIFWYASSQWPTVVRDLVVALTADHTHDEIAYVVVTSTSQMNSAISLFTAGGADMSKVEFIIEPGNAIWIRDYGPHFIWQDGALGIVDSHYYPSRPLDNFIPTLLGDDHFIMPTYDMGLYYSGGNFLPGPNRSAFVSSLINLDNPASHGFNESFIAELYQTYQGIDDLHIMPQLPFSVDGTGHIDMWMYIIDEDTVIISEFIAGSNPTAIEITNNAVPYMEDLGFEVFRTPAWNSGGTHYTYTNTFRVNDRIFTSTYGEGNPSYLDEDARAQATYARAVGPDVELVPIDCYSIIPAAGAIHCIVMQVPRHTEPDPSVHVVWPDGGELLVSGTTQTILWTATDTNNTVIPQIDLYYSIDGGNSYEFIDTTTDTGSYEWTVPYVSTEQAKVKVIATSADLDQGEAVSADVFQITPAQQTTYDFTSGASVDKFGYGYQTSSWYYVDGDRTPVTTEIDTLVSGAYNKIAYSDAVGGDSDPNRYISPYPSGAYESTHIYEFTINEDPAEIDDIEILWEGYADDCTQIELYVWDYHEGQWSDGKGLYDQNRFMDNWAGNRDGYLKNNIRSNFNRYINPSGQMTLLLYAERYGDRTFHDYITVTISDIIPTAPEITNVDVTPFIQDVNGWTNITCEVSSLIALDQVKVNITYPDDSTFNQTMINIPGTDSYYLNATYTDSGTYTFFIWANDTSGNENTSENYYFLIGYYLNLVDFPMYEAEVPNNEMCGPAVLQMNLDYMWWNSSVDPELPTWANDNGWTQTELFDRGVENNSNISLGYLDATGLQHMIQNLDPTFYNFGIYQNTDYNDAIADICRWIDYEVTLAPEGYPNHVPGAVPAYGDYSNWMSIRGIHTNTSAYGASSLTVHGFWVNDPYPGGIGENSYKMASEWNSTYYLPISVPDDPYNGKYIAVCEPPESATGDIILTDVTEYWENQFPDPPGGHFLQQVIDHVVVYAARQGVRDRLMPYDPDFEAVFEQSYPGRPVLVKNLVEEKNDYYIVPFNSEPISWIPRAGHSDPEGDTTMAVVLVDATNGQFKEASWVHEPVVYLPISETDALDIVLDLLEDLGYNVGELNTRAIQPDLVYRNASPYHPEWKVTINELGLTFFINQEGMIII